jgi:hypothetical protein
MTKTFNPCKTETAKYEEPNSENVKVGDVYLHRTLSGRIIPFSVKRISSGFFGAEKIEKSPGLVLTFPVYEDAVILRNSKENKGLLVGRNCTKNIEDYLAFTKKRAS